MRWQRSISISSVISNLFLVIFITSSLKFSQVLLYVSGMPSIRILLSRDLSSSHVNFSMAKVGCKRSSTVSLRSVSTFLISFLTLATLSLSYPWVNTRFLVMPITSCEILSSRSLVFVSWEFYRIYIYIKNLYFKYMGRNLRLNKITCNGVAQNMGFTNEMFTKVTFLSFFLLCKIYTLNNISA